jgi:hypothetical protein
VNYSSTLEGTAPTGDKAAGFSTGRTTVDWTNRFSHTFSAVTPFAGAGLANTVSDTSFFVRPFTSLGIVSHFDGGAKLRVSQFTDVGASAYALRASGQQKIISKISQNTPPTTSSSGSTSAGSRKNRPFETAARCSAQPNSLMITVFDMACSTCKFQMDFQIGYTRSAGYDLNTFFFAVGLPRG